MQIPSERNDVPAVSNWEKMPPLNWGSNRGSTKPVWLWAFQLSSLGQRCLSSSGKCFCPDKCLPAWQGASRLQLHPLPWTPLPPGADDCQIPMVGLGRLPLNPELLIISWTLRTSEQPIGSWTHDSPTFQPHLYFMGFFFFFKLTVPNTETSKRSNLRACDAVKEGEPPSRRPDLGQRTHAVRAWLSFPRFNMGTIIVYSSLESSQSDPCLPFNVSLYYFPSSGLCFRHASLPALPKSQQLCSFMPRASARTAVFCLKCFSFPCPPGELLPFFMSPFKSSLP